ncbi:MAG: hypothetical protein E6H07_13175 [Bacteroidetes bacterium]|nr:MAG: hypothetical protein E6H07_13175 [Bacteroidota bacterium]
MFTIANFPIFILTNPERFWLDQVYDWNRQGKRFSFEHVRVKLEGRIPNDFTYQEIDSRLLEHNGCSITILGILALDPESFILQEINATAKAIRQLIMEDVDRHTLSIEQISSITGLTSLHTSFIIHLLSLIGHFNTGGSFEENLNIYKSIRIGGNETIFNNYVAFPGVEKIILNRLKSYGYPPGAKFSQEEIFTANEKLDLIIEKIETRFEGTQLELHDIRNEINEMRNYFSLPKRSWWHMLLGKLGEMTLSGIVSETLSKEIISTFSNVIRRIGF